jgi:hypothetical protein
MIAWIIGIITAILLGLALWRARSRDFRERAERPKHAFLDSLSGVKTHNHNPEMKTRSTQE